MSEDHESNQSTDLALPWLQTHSSRLKEKRGCIVVVLEAEGDLGVHHAGVADGQGLHVLGVPPLPVPLSRLAAVQWTKEEGFLAENIPLLDNLLLPHGLLTMRKHDPKELCSSTCELSK